MSESSPPGPTRRRKLRRRRTPHGAPPCTLTIDPEAPRPSMHLIGYGPDQVTEEDLERPSLIRKHLDKWPVVWVDVAGLGDEQILREIGEIFDIHGLALEDVVNVHQRSKVEEYEDHIFIVSRMITPGERFETEQLSLFLGRGWVLTFQERPGDCLDPLRRRIRHARGLVRKMGADFLAYALLDAVVDGYFPMLEQCEADLDRLEEQIMRVPRSDVISHLHAMRHTLQMLRRSILPLREALSSLLRDQPPQFTDQVLPYLRDCQDHTVQILDEIDTQRELCASLADLHLSNISHRMNEVMKVLTIFATIFIPIGVIAGIYGMNFNTERSPWNMPELNWAFGYPFALGLMAAVAAVLLFLFRRWGWLGGAPAAKRRGEPPAGEGDRG
ncbi:magnesium/cobalt transporter CorA [Candidatus Sumerlaeota bacterium]|nr:magnesium/cobalt transporter CorA [Candidatus Sumerlaeota bacterium]